MGRGRLMGARTGPSKRRMWLRMVAAMLLSGCSAAVAIVVVVWRHVTRSAARWRAERQAGLEADDATVSLDDAVSTSSSTSSSRRVVDVSL